MTSVSINTSNTNATAVLSIPTSSAYNRKKNLLKGLYSYTVSPKIGYRKLSVQFASADWDVNRNELEFE